MTACFRSSRSKASTRTSSLNKDQRRGSRLLDRKHTGKTLRFMTYMSPDLPISLFEVIRDYLEEKLCVNALLITESRWTGPPEGRTDPLTADEADVVFLSGTSFLAHKMGNKYMELCNAVPLHLNSRTSDETVCFCEVVVLKKRMEQHIFKNFESLRGSRWAYSQHNSVTGSIAMLSELRRRGYNANFFGSTHQSGSHLNSLQMLLNGQVDVASVNSLVMAAFKIMQPAKEQELAVIKSLGPLPIYSIVFNSRVPAKRKEDITQALLSVGEEENKGWEEQFTLEGIKGFAAPSENNFSLENTLVDSIKDMSIAPAYY